MYKCKLFLVLALIIQLTSTFAHATTYSFHSAWELTTRSDAWIRARVQDVEVISEHNSFGDNWVRLRLVLDVSDSVGLELDGLIEATGGSFRMNFRDRRPNFREKVEIFTAIRSDDEGLHVQGTIPNEGWYRVGLDGYGNKVDENIFWRYLQDIRFIVDNEGVISEDIRRYWTRILKSKDINYGVLALQVLNESTEEGNTPIELANAVIRYTSLLPDSISDEAELEQRVFSRLLETTINTITLTKNRTAAITLSNYLLNGNRLSEFINKDKLEFYLVSMLLTAGTETHINIFKEKLGSEIFPSSEIIGAIGQFGGRHSSPILWDLLTNAAEYRIDPKSVWGTLGWSGDEKIQDYLERNILGMSQSNDVEREAAFRVLHFLSPEVLDRSSYIKYGIDSIVAGDRYALGRFAQNLRPEDKQYASWLARFKVNVPFDNDVPPKKRQRQIQGMREHFINEVILRIPDLAFVPRLKEWAKDNPSAVVLAALYNCGEEELALRYAEESLSEEVGHQYFEHSPRYAVMKFLATRDNSRATVILKHYFSDLSVEVDEFSEIILKNGDEIWPLELLPYLVRSREGKLVSLLQQVLRHESIRSKLVAVLCLYGFDPNFEHELLDIIRNREESEHPQIKDIRERGWRIDAYFINGIISALSTEATDRLVLERLDRDFDSTDTYLLYDLGYSRRLNMRELPKLLKLLDAPDFDEIRGVVSSFWKIQDSSYRYVYRYSTEEPRYIRDEVLRRLKTDIEEYIQMSEVSTEY